MEMFLSWYLCIISDRDLRPAGAALFGLLEAALDTPLPTFIFRGNAALFGLGELILALLGRAEDFSNKSFPFCTC